MAMLVTCSVCGTERETTREEVLAGTWRDGCPVCARPAKTGQTPPTVCEGCGRPLRAGRRRVCARCLGVAA